MEHRHARRHSDQILGISAHTLSVFEIQRIRPSQKHAVEPLWKFFGHPSSEHGSPAEAVEIELEIFQSANLMNRPTTFDQKRWCLRVGVLEVRPVVRQWVRHL